MLNPPIGAVHLPLKQPSSASWFRQELRPPHAWIAQAQTQFPGTQGHCRSCRAPTDEIPWSTEELQCFCMLLGCLTSKFQKVKSLTRMAIAMSMRIPSIHIFTGLQINYCKLGEA